MDVRAQAAREVKLSYRCSSAKENILGGLRLLILFREEDDSPRAVAVCKVTPILHLFLSFCRNEEKRTDATA
jgi:hypothetical protein